MVGGRAGELPVDAWLGAVGRELSDQRPELEYSVRLARDRVSASGRVTCWVSQTVNAGLAVERLLTHFGAPADVLASRQGGERWVRQGVGIDATGAEPAYRYYLHSRRPETLAPEYRSWCWVRGGPATARRYSFHFLPETPQGLRPAELVPAELRPPLAELLASEQLRRCSGFWLRTTPTGEIDQLDLALPWQPAASSLPGLADIIALAGSGGDFRWQDLPIRHVALSLGPSPLTVTLYVRGAAGGTWPADEGAMRAQARNGAAQAGRQVRRLMIEHLPASDSVSESAGQPLGSFYDGDVATWRQVLGDRMHYHHGLFHDELAPDLTAALDRAVTELYPFIPAGGRLYDVGCGWGGALRMFISDLGCPSLGLTISGAQYRHIATSGLPVRWGDAEQTLPPGFFDCAVLLESFEHIRDKRRLLETLRIFAGRLVMRVNCQDLSAPSSVFAGTMHMISSTSLRSMLEATGWRIEHWRDRRAEALPSVAAWHSRAAEQDLVRDKHLDTLQAWSSRVMRMPAEWAAANPLIEVACTGRTAGK